MMRSDVHFNYNNITRFVLLHKLSIVNSFSIPFLYKLVCFFSIKNLEDVNDVRVYNYFFFLKFFFGSRAFFSSYSKEQGFGRTAYNFNVQIILRKKDVYYPISFMTNNVFHIVDQEYLYYNIKKISPSYVCSVTIKDMNIFSEKKTNLGLFNLKDNFNLKFFVFSQNFLYTKLYFNNIKLYFIK